MRKILLIDTVRSWWSCIYQEFKEILEENKPGIEGKSRTSTQFITFEEIFPPLLNRYTQNNNFHIWARGPAKPPCRLFKDICRYVQISSIIYKRKNRSTKAGHENPQKTSRWKKHGERVPPTKAVVQPLGF